jgi:phage tail-like protein
MALSSDARLGLAMRFKVVVDGVDLGGWESCHGLAVDFHPKAIKEGGENGYVHWLPDRADYQPIKLTRAMTSSDAGHVQSWLSSKVGNYTGGTAQITLFDAWGGPVHTWSLRNVFPKSWLGPDMKASVKDIAIETLELVHEGFL